MAINTARLRKLHYTLAPLMAFPLVLTLMTGIAYQMAIATGQGAEFNWLLALHRGQFGSINLELIYPVLNGLGLLTMVITGVVLWIQRPGRL